MKKLCTVLLISLWTLQVYSQTVKTEYYDPYSKTLIMAKYQVNSVGEKHGWFKGYDKQGVLITEYNFKNNLMDGLNKEYATYTGSRTLEKSETYKNGELDGPAVYYMNGTIIEGKGNYVNGKKDGKWYRIYSYSYDDIKRFHEIDGKLKDFVSSEEIYSMGKIVNPESGEVKEYFYPSKKLRSILNYKESFKFGKCIWYYPTGAIETEEMYGEKGRLIYSKTFYVNGNLKEYSGTKDGVEHFEQYSKDGSQTRTMEKMTRVRENLINEKLFLQKGDSCFSINKLTEAKDYYLKAKESYTQAGKTDYRYLNPSPLGDQKKKIIESIDEGKYHEALNKSKLLKTEGDNSFYNIVYSNYIKWLDTNFDTWAQSYDAKTMNAWLPSMKADLTSNDYQKFETQTKETEDSYKKIQDLDGKMKVAFESLGVTTYGKFKLAVIEKAKSVIEKYSEEYALELTFDGMMQKGQKVIDAINKVINYTDDESKEFSKQLKNIDDLEQIKTILKI